MIVPKLDNFIRVDKDELHHVFVERVLKKDQLKCTLKLRTTYGTMLVDEAKDVSECIKWKTEISA